ncbi:MAG: hypothetical protein HY699_08665 [Deltaproteobacteria bacterium]|nr:hypothetical protein [Deltaproteobacteria bacterium]
MRAFVTLTSTLAVLLLARSALAQQATEPLHFSKLIPLLPDKVAGFVAEKAQGSTSAAMGFKVTEVSRTYHKDSEDSEHTVTVKITDGTGNQFFNAAYAAMPQFSNESTDGYEKGFPLDGNPATERYNTDNKYGSLTVFLAGRYLVQIDINGLDPKTMQEWWKKIEVKKLAELKS